MTALFLEEEKEIVNLDLVENVTIEKAANEAETFLISFHFQSGRQAATTKKQSEIEDFISQIFL